MIRGVGGEMTVAWCASAIEAARPRSHAGNAAAEVKALGIHYSTARKFSQLDDARKEWFAAV